MQCRSISPAGVCTKDILSQSSTACHQSQVDSVQGLQGNQCYIGMQLEIDAVVLMLCRVSCVGIYVASMVTGKGPYALLLEHVIDPVHHNAVQNLL